MWSGTVALSEHEAIVVVVESGLPKTWSVSSISYQHWHWVCMLELRILGDEPAAGRLLETSYITGSPFPWLLVSVRSTPPHLLVEALQSEPRQQYCTKYC